MKRSAPNSLHSRATRVSKVRRKMGISEATFYNGKKKYGGLGVTELRRFNQLESIQGVR